MPTELSVPPRHRAARAPHRIRRIGALTMTITAVSIALVALAASLLPTQVDAAVFGMDDRTAIPTRYQKAAESIGLLFNNQTRTVCTAFCVAPNVIATASHCLFKAEIDTHSKLSQYWFARGYDRQRDFSRIAGFSTNSTLQHIMSGATRLSTRPPIDAASDWALVRLARPACHGGVLPVRPIASDAIIKAAAGQRIFQIAYHRDLPQWKPVYSQPCRVDRRFGAIDWTMIARDFTTPEHLVLHLCDTGGASSGSPLLMDTPEGPAVIGINIGTYEQARVLVQAGQVTHRFKSETVANTGVNADVFASRVDLMARARVLTTAAAIGDLQTRLQMRGFYAGPIDGSFGQQLRQAIEQFETFQRLPRTGLPTTELAQRLGTEIRPAAEAGTVAARTVRGRPPAAGATATRSSDR